MKTLKRTFLGTVLTMMLFSACSTSKTSLSSAETLNYQSATNAIAKTEIAKTETRSTTANSNIVAETPLIASTDQNAIYPISRSTSSANVVEKILPTNTTETAKTFKTPVNVKQNLIKNEVKSAKKQNSSGKSQLVAALLCFFLGSIGIHRFYLGYTTIGILQLVTLGGCGIWAFIDLIRILLGDLRPKDEDYTDTF